METDSREDQWRDSKNCRRTPRESCGSSDGWRRVDDGFPDKEETFHIAFPHQHTLDQEEAIHGIMADMNSEKPMDRLLSGDVGFGKTEVSLHAVYRAFLNEKQTIFLAPLVVLAYEHYESIRERLKPFGVNVAMMTRMSTTKEIKAVLAGLKDGSIHCVIGTHRLLSPDIKFRNLWLVVVDEEHKFGVTDKEKIMHLKAGVDTLALSATPIPRSLNLALSGVKNFSILSTPPMGKKPIHTAVARYDQTIVKRAIEEELARGGKVFFVHNTIKTLPILKKKSSHSFPRQKSLSPMDSSHPTNSKTASWNSSSACTMSSSPRQLLKTESTSSIRIPSSSMRQKTSDLHSCTSFDEE
jgi:transcription-repair coupling factor (superfamily II helicase)